MEKLSATLGEFAQKLRHRRRHLSFCEQKIGQLSTLSWTIDFYIKGSRRIPSHVQDGRFSQVSLKSMSDCCDGPFEDELLTGTCSALPAPIYSSSFEYEDVPTLPLAPTPKIPKYGARRSWKPKTDIDFNGGGAYPEVSRRQGRRRLWG